MLAFIATAAVAAPTQAPFHGTIDTIETTESVEYPTLFGSAVGVGRASHLGKFAWSLNVEIDISKPEQLTAIGTATLTAANGDKLFTTFVATGTPTGTPNVIFIEEHQTITGGTGRFVGATGTFTRLALSDLALGVSSGSFKGEITY